MLHLLPCAPITIAPKEGGYRYVSISAYWLIFGLTLAYHAPSGFMYDADGKSIGYNPYPAYRMDVVDARN